MRRPYPPSTKATPQAFTLTELLAAIVIISLLITLSAQAARQLILSSSLSVSANNIRQLAAGASAYLGDHNYHFWKYREMVNEPGRRGVRWWFGFEPNHSLSLPEGQRILDTSDSPLAGYIPGGLRPDPSFAFTGKPFKPKFKFGYIGIGYNVLLGGRWMGGPTASYFQLEKPDQTVVFATSAQVNTFQPPASPKNPMIEEFYGLDDREVTVHFRHRGKAMVSFATGNVGFLPMDPSTLDQRAPNAQVGRFAPVGDPKFLR